MYRNRLATTTKPLLRHKTPLQELCLQHSKKPLNSTPPRLSCYYSSLRSTRQLGPRSRALNHVEGRQKPIIRSTVETIAPKTATTQIPNTYETHSTSPSDSTPTTEPVVNTLVEVPAAPNQIIKPDYKGASLLAQPAIVVGRELEMLNVFLGYEQANRYKIMDPEGNLIGYIAEEEGLAKSVGRQLLRTHRKMNATILNPQGEVIYKIMRPYSLINSRIFIYTADDELVGEVQQRWHLLKRKYDLFVGNNQFAMIDTPFLGWDFNLQDEEGKTLGNVSRNFVGFAREIFTDSGQYVLRMDAADSNARGMTLDERAVTLACAISIDFDYFSRHSTHGGGGFMPFPIFGMGGPHETAGNDDHDSQPTTTNVDPGMGSGGAAAGGAAGTMMGGGGSYSSEDYGHSGSSSPPPPPPPQEQTNAWGESPWLSDDQAGVSNPDDSAGGGFFEALSDFFGDND